MTGRITRTLHITLPGGRTSPDSVAQLIDTIFSKGLENGERVDSIKGNIADMGETFSMEVVLSTPADVVEQLRVGGIIVEDERR